VSTYTDPLPQALVLTAIVISFGMTALIVVLALRGFLEIGSDRVERSPEKFERARRGPGEEGARP
jgi:multicomponent K+:H+ antiporter subunit C